MGDSMEAHDWMHGSLQRSQDTINAKLAGGLPFLATVGATAPFVGLLGTVIGISRALTHIALAGSASIDQVAGHVGRPDAPRVGKVCVSPCRDRWAPYPS